MALEKKLRSIPPQAFTSNGTFAGKLTVADSTIFRVEQQVLLRATGEQPLPLAVKDIPDLVTIIVGPANMPLSAVADISLYTTAKSATIEADRQVRPSVIDQDIQRATYEEAPVDARRTYPVDKIGKRYDDSNPFPVASQNSLIKKLYDELNVASMNDCGDPTLIEVKYQTQLVATINIQYDADNNLTNVKYTEA